LAIDRDALIQDRAQGASLSALARAYGISRALVSKFLKEAQGGGHKTSAQTALQISDNKTPKSKT
jgi:transposase-like protein